VHSSALHYSSSVCSRCSDLSYQCYTLNLTSSDTLPYTHHYYQSGAILLEEEDFLFLSHKHPNSDVKFSLIYKKRPLYVLLNDKSVVLEKLTLMSMRTGGMMLTLSLLLIKDSLKLLQMLSKCVPSLLSHPSHRGTLRDRMLTSWLYLSPSTIVFHKPLDFLESAGNVDPLTPVETGWLQNPQVLPNKVTLRHWILPWVEERLLPLVAV
jgi:hypothetical protein